MAAVAIVGAGMAGAAAARGLSRAGHRVAVFDKGRGPGGRMATRRLPSGARVDHGAAYVTARDPGFAAALRELGEAGAVADWGEAGWSVGVPAMTQPVRALTEGIDVATGVTVGRLSRDEAGWRLRDATGAPLGGLFDAVLVTAPAPQARTLIAGAGVDGQALWPALVRVRYAPCWALIVAHSGEPAFSESHRRDRDRAAPIAWIARDATKPGRAAAEETLVVHASAQWSRRHLERDAGEVAALLLAELRTLLGGTAPAAERVTDLAAHRWRFAKVEEAAGEPCLWSPDLRLGVAGDGCLGGRVEAAYLSGTALAARVQEALG